MGTLLEPSWNVYSTPFEFPTAHSPVTVAVPEPSGAVHVIRPISTCSTSNASCLPKKYSGLTVKESTVDSHNISSSSAAWLGLTESIRGASLTAFLSKTVTIVVSIVSFSVLSTTVSDTCVSPTGNDSSHSI